MSQTEKNNYATYQSMVNTVTVGLTEAKKACRELQLLERVKTLEEIEDKFKTDQFSVGIMGEFRRGKSTVINALLGKEIVPSDIVPTSAVPNYIRWGTKEEALIRFKDGTTKTVPVEELIQYVTKITEEYEEVSATVEDAVVSYPCQFCQNGVQIVDTPGLNDDTRMTYVSEQVLPILDVIIIVLTPDSPFSATELDFLFTKVLVSSLGRIVFVLNKIDVIDEDDRELLVECVRERIEKGIADRFAELEKKLGRESLRAKENSESKLGGIRLYPISARNALKAKLKGEERRLQESGMPAFEEALSQILTQERGLLKLMTPVNQLRAAITEASGVVNTRYEAFRMDYEEFRRIHEEQKEEWVKRREEKKRYVAELKGKASGAYQALVVKVPGMYQDLIGKLTELIEQYEIPVSAVKSEKEMALIGQDMEKQLQKALENTLSEDVQLLSIGIQEQIGDNLLDINQFSGKVSESVMKFNSYFEKQGGPGTGATIAVDIATNIFLGGWCSIGGIIEGWKASGLPGALVGGAGGAAIGIGAMVLAATLGTGVFAAWAIGGVVTTLTGKKIVATVFKEKVAEKNIQRIKSAMKQQIEEQVTAMRAKRVLESWLQEQTYAAYEQVSKNVDEELERVLTDFEQQMDLINTQLTQGEMEQKQMKQKLEKISANLAEIAEDLAPVYEKLNEALNLQG